MERRPSGLRALAAALSFTILAAGGTSVVMDTPLSAPVKRLLGKAPERLLPPVVAASSGPHRFLRLHDGSTDPVTFDPCRPVAIVLNPRSAPAGSLSLVREAMAEVSRRTGLDLRLVGTTDERPHRDREASDPERYGAGWSPVLLSWSDASETPMLAGAVAGVGGGIARAPRLSSRMTFVSGSVTLDAEDLGAAMQRTGGAAEVRAIVLHELAHLVGLDHVDAPGELMQPMNQGQHAFGPGDLEGLARLGAGDCRL